MKYYYATKESGTVGPLEEEEFREHAQDKGLIDPKSLVWRTGMPKWVPFQEAKEIFYNHSDVKTLVKDVAQRHKSDACLDVAGRAEFAGIGIRFLATIIDFIVLATIIFVLLLPVYGERPLSEVGSDHNVNTYTGLTTTLLQVFMPFLYETLLVGAFGGTLGKLALGLRVVKSNWGKVSYARSAGRYFAKILSNLTLGIGHLIMIFDAEKRALQDHICSTRVIRRG